MNTLPVPSSCCTPCDEIPSVAVPGPAGTAGTDGISGTNGTNAYTTTTASFTMPAEGATVSVSVATSAWMVIGQTLYVQTAGFMEVSSLPNANTAVLRNPENTAASTYAINAAPGTNIPSSSKVAPGGLQGPSGTLSGAAGGDLKGTYPNPKIGKANTKGQMIVGDGTDVANFSVGANGTVVHADSTQALGVRYGSIDRTGVNTSMSGATPIAGGGTGNTTQTAAFNALSPVTTRGDVIVRDATNNVRKAIGTIGQVFVSDGTDPQWALLTSDNLSAALARVTPDYILIREEQASGVNGGAFTNGAWRTRALSTEVADTGAHAVLTAPQITLQAGTYRFRAVATAYQVDLHKLRLRNITAGTDIAIGINARSAATDGSMTLAEVSGRFTLAGATVLELQHQAQTSKVGDGLGVASSMGTEVYSQIEFWREAA